MAKKADEIKEGLTKDEARNFYSGAEQFVQTDEEPKGNKKTVIGIIEAEKLQKSGWQLISATPVSKDPFGDKEYKFERNK